MFQSCQYLTSNKGKKILIVNNYMFYSNTFKKNKTYWECVRRKDGCRVRVATENEVVSRIIYDHNHGSEDAAIRTNKFMAKMKEEIKNNPTAAIPEIYRKLLLKEATSDDDAALLPDFNTARSSLYRTHRTKCGDIPSSRKKETGKEATTPSAAISSMPAYVAIKSSLYRSTSRTIKDIIENDFDDKDDIDEIISYETESYQQILYEKQREKFNKIFNENLSLPKQFAVEERMLKVYFEKYEEKETSVSSENELNSEQPVPKEKLTDKSRRIVDLVYFIKQLQNLDNHNSEKNCNFSDMDLLHEHRRGLSSCLSFMCNKCKVVKEVYTNENKENAEPLNVACISAMNDLGRGYFGLQGFLLRINVPSMSVQTYAKGKYSIRKTQPKFDSTKDVESSDKDYHQSNRTDSPNVSDIHNESQSQPASLEPAKNSEEFSNDGFESRPSTFDCHNESAPGPAFAEPAAETSNEGSDSKQSDSSNSYSKILRKRTPLQIFPSLASIRDIKIKDSCTSSNNKKSKQKLEKIQPKKRKLVDKGPKITKKIISSPVKMINRDTSNSLNLVDNAKVQKYFSYKNFSVSNPGANLHTYTRTTNFERNYNQFHSKETSDVPIKLEMDFEISETINPEQDLNFIASQPFNKNQDISLSSGAVNVVNSKLSCSIVTEKGNNSDVSPTIFPIGSEILNTSATNNNSDILSKPIKVEVDTDNFEEDKVEVILPDKDFVPSLDINAKQLNHIVCSKTEISNSSQVQNVQVTQISKGENGEALGMESVSTSTSQSVRNANERVTHVLSSTELESVKNLNDPLPIKQEFVEVDSVEDGKDNTVSVNNFAKLIDSVAEKTQTSSSNNQVIVQQTSSSYAQPESKLRLPSGEVLNGMVNLNEPPLRHNNSFINHTVSNDNVSINVSNNQSVSINNVLQNLQNFNDSYPLNSVIPIPQVLNSGLPHNMNSVMYRHPMNVVYQNPHIVQNLQRPNNPQLFVQDLPSNSTFMARVPNPDLSFSANVNNRFNYYSNIVYQPTYNDISIQRWNAQFNNAHAVSSRPDSQYIRTPFVNTDRFGHPININSSFRQSLNVNQTLQQSVNNQSVPTVIIPLGENLPDLQQKLKESVTILQNMNCTSVSNLPAQAQSSAQILNCGNIPNSQESPHDNFISNTKMPNNDTSKVRSEHKEQASPSEQMQNSENIVHHTAEER